MALKFTWKVTQNMSKQNQHKLKSITQLLALYMQMKCNVKNVSKTFKSIKNYLGETNLISCFTGPTDPKIWKIEIKIKLILVAHILFSLLPTANFPIFDSFSKFSRNVCSIFLFIHEFTLFAPSYLRFRLLIQIY